ncbi:MAG: hypothetical protein AMXMBFR56_72780 [Polyangiaceae bacterium]
MSARFDVGVRIVVVGGRWAGRAGVVRKGPSKLFPEYLYVDLDKTARERTQKTREFVALADLRPESEGA